MCIALPMTVVECSGTDAVCEREGKRHSCTALLCGSIRPGDHVLVFRGEVLRRVEAEEADRIEAALRCVEKAMGGQEPDVDEAFADILANTGKLPEHLRKAVPN